MMGPRRVYSVFTVFNSRKFSRIVIDQHYQEKHSDSVTDEIILELVRSLDGQSFAPVSRQGDFEFFRIDPVILADKSYRLILTTCESEDFMGVINAFRIRVRPKLE